MLLELNVKDIALIRKASVSFGNGLNILTGETGAGKSVIIDSVMLALGGKAKGDIIRSGAEYAYIELIFDAGDRLERLKDLGVCPDENGEVIISRRIMQGRSVSRINDETVTLSRLREITGLLIDIYGQNEFHTLMDKKQHLKILDSYISDDIGILKAETEQAFREYSRAKKAAGSFTMDEKERKRELDMLTYELEEIDGADLKESEEEELSAYFKKLNNLRNIMEYAESANESISSFALERAISNIEQAMKYDEGLKTVYDELLDAQSILDAVLKDLGGYISGLEVDDGELDRVERRLDQIRGLEAKYGRDYAEIKAYRDGIEKRMEELSNYESDMLKAEEDAENALKRFSDLSARLSLHRKEGAKKLCGAVISELKELGFDKAVVDMEFKAAEPSLNGTDEVTFLAAFNPGEALKPLQEVASGGELSRMMLALKTVLAETDDMPTLIFDEIDTGISGRTAQKVAEKMAKIARKHQVICVSHLPQIAAMADTHFVISKEEKDGRNITSIDRLDSAGSLRELARLLQGAEITRAVEENALEMKKLADRIKAGIGGS